MSKEEKSSLWSQRIREFRSSGQTCKDWCGEHQLPVSTMTYWLRKLKREEESAGDAGPVFAKLPSEAEIAMRDTAENSATAGALSSRFCSGTDPYETS